MGAGIAEIALPMDFRLRNIERTAEAKAALQAKRDGVFMRRERAPTNRRERWHPLEPALSNPPLP